MKSIFVNVSRYGFNVNICLFHGCNLWTFLTLVSHIYSFGEVGQDGGYDSGQIGCQENKRSQHTFPILRKVYFSTFLLTSGALDFTHFIILCAFITPCLLEQVNPDDRLLASLHFVLFFSLCGVGDQLICGKGSLSIRPVFRLHRPCSCSVYGGLKFPCCSRDQTITHPYDMGWSFQVCVGTVERGQQEAGRTI